jgi:hypothetical protein
MMWRRRELQPLKVKSFRLIFVSVIASGLMIISNLSIKLLKNYASALTDMLKE